MRFLGPLTPVGKVVAKTSQRNLKGQVIDHFIAGVKMVRYQFLLIRNQL